MVRHILDEDENKQGSVIGDFNQWNNDPVHMASRQNLPLQEITYAERLKQNGYYNAFIGKWHLGGEAYYPIHQGFDEEIGVTPFGHPKSYYQPFFKSDNPFASAGEDEYLTDVVTAKTLDFIKNYDKSKPFELSLYYYNVHSPQIGRKDLFAKYKAAGLSDIQATYASKVSAVDESVGKIRQALQQKGIADNTVILFLSDQGGFFSNAPLSGAKTGGNTLGEGGARVPLVAYYPGVTKAGSVCNTPVQSLDVYPTLIEIASGKLCTDKQINGTSLMPLFKCRDIKPRNLFFFRSYEDQYAAVINGDWKLIKYHSGLYHLFNIKNDLSEQKDLYSATNTKAIELKNALAKWEKEVLPKPEK
jgi:arylsulfatase A-like enzyme